MNRIILIFSILGFNSMVSVASEFDRDREVLKCESREYGFNNCKLSFPSRFLDVSIKEKISRAPCSEGESWGLAYQSIWVDYGCAAKFAIETQPGRHFMLCSSVKFKPEICPLSLDTAVDSLHLVEQYSGAECIRGVSWGVRDDYLWVDHGCDGLFSFWIETYDLEK